MEKLKIDKVYYRYAISLKNGMSFIVNSDIGHINDFLTHVYKDDDKSFIIFESFDRFEHVGEFVDVEHVIIRKSEIASVSF